MFSKAFITLLAMASVAFAAPTPVAEPTAENLVERAVAYKMFTGNGSNWPAISAWTTFETMWANSQSVMTISCKQFGGAANNSPAEIANIKSAITSVAASSGVDARFILAIVMQESGGCVRAPSTAGQVFNPGLMQDHNGAHSCNMNGNPISPCPAATITGMIKDGTVGTYGVVGGGDGLQQCLTQSGSPKTAQGAYAAARIYNSGTYVKGTDLGAPLWGTSCYASDVANRLLGWAAPVTPCVLPNPVH
ncbi:uncharacterized protein EAE97_001199 [Botrytis byssoidea]|uniref:Transglycosylase SLT domain-containing protein n=1 Tax=Botrytis byssoidea TaxID=139641 RepID=A0A9P5M8D5_9HELO|nr:uncharacterized protein EAE97_001199 [Botrytis byssoidea]KAF7953800.1 hypothetical protein EAE97_001199 [Botrytis byssoidea]